MCRALKRVANVPIVAVVVFLGFILGRVVAEKDVKEQLLPVTDAQVGEMLFLYLPVLIFTATFSLRYHLFWQCFWQCALLGVGGLCELPLKRSRRIVILRCQKYIFVINHRVILRLHEGHVDTDIDSEFVRLKRPDKYAQKTNPFKKPASTFLRNNAFERYVSKLWLAQRKYFGPCCICSTDGVIR